MAKKTSAEQPVCVDAALVITKEEFKHLLEQQIEKGKKLLAIKVPLINQQYGGFYGLNRERVQYDEQKKEFFIADFNRWHDMNIEIYKSSFSVPNNTYRKAYESQIWRLLGTDIIKEYKDDMNRLINQMISDIEKLPLIKSEVREKGNSTQKVMETSIDKIFIVHGHDGELKEKVARTLSQLGLKPIILHEQVDGGRTIIEKFEDNAEDCGFAIILLTADDIGQSKKEKEQGGEPRNRARQNVVFEMGYFMGRLTRKRVFVLLDKDVDKPGNLDGLVYVSTTDDYSWKVRLVKELQNCGYVVDMNKIL